MVQKLTVSDVVPATPDEIFSAWLDSKAHTAMTGAPAKASAKIGGKFTAWDGYAYGENLELVPGEKIVQSWRSSDFADNEADSRLTVSLKAVAGGTRVSLTHSGIPDSQSGYRDGWVDYYLTPMKAYFAKPRKPVRSR
jgi:uncharacterized protein YndB with AHSA1/START domain